MAVETMRRKATFATITAAAGDRNLPAMVISTINPDRVGDRVIPEGLDASAFLKNPALMFGHAYHDLPVGTVTSIAVEPGKHIRASWRWLENDAFADRVKNAWDQGVLRAASIGFRPLRTKPNSTGGADVLAWELLELSLVAIPANAECVRTLKSLGLYDDRDPIVARLINDTDDDPMVKFDPDDLRDALRRILPEVVKAAVRREAERTLKRVIAQARGQVLDGAELAGIGEPTKARGVRR